MSLIDKELEENRIYIFKDNKVIELDKPKNGFGKTTIHWQDGKPVRTEVNYSNNLK